jgi:hypothetical protein
MNFPGIFSPGKKMCLWKKISAETEKQRKQRKKEEDEEETEIEELVAIDII